MRSKGALEPDCYLPLFVSDFEQWQAEDMSSIPSSVPFFQFIDFQ
jgi:hypothetical protein